MSGRPYRECALCRELRLLCDSHLIPAAALAMLLSPTLKSPHPIHVSDDQHYTTSQPLKHYLLCAECEGRFHSRGEDWMLSHCHRAEDDFKLRELLLATRPFFIAADGLTIYRGASVPTLKPEQLTYFALSVFWRAAVHTWKCGLRLTGIDLGPYLESLRLFLLDLAPFPQSMALVVRISSLTEWVPNVNYPETADNSHGFRLHGFTIPGLSFFLLVGARLPAEALEYCTAPGLDCFVGMSPINDREDLTRLLTRFTSAKARGFRSPAPR